MEAKRRLIKLLIDNQDNNLQFLREILNYLSGINTYGWLNSNNQLNKDYQDKLSNYIDIVDKILQENKK